MAQQTINEWYDMPMPCRILTREQEVVEYEAGHPEVNPKLWQWVDHPMRIMREWALDDTDIVLFDEGTNTYKMVQDEYFKDSFTTNEDWWAAVLGCIRVHPAVFVVRHLK